MNDVVFLCLSVFFVCVLGEGGVEAGGGSCGGGGVVIYLKGFSRGGRLSVFFFFLFRWNFLFLPNFEVLKFFFYLFSLALFRVSFFTFFF